jgi:hypothetical protein
LDVVDDDDDDDDDDDESMERVEEIGSPKLLDRPQRNPDDSSLVDTK